MTTLQIKSATTTKAKNGLAWLSFILAAIGGVTATASWVGDMVSGVVSIFWWWAPFALIAIVGLIIVGDVLSDGIPNRTAVYGAILWPSFVLSVEGKLGRLFDGWITDLNRYLDGKIAEYITDVPRGSAGLMTAISVTAIAFAIVHSHRYAKKAKKAKKGDA